MRQHKKLQPIQSNCGEDQRIPAHSMNLFMLARFFILNTRLAQTKVKTIEDQGDQVSEESQEKDRATSIH